MEKAIKKIRSAVLRAKRNGGGRTRYPDFIKSAAAELVRDGQSPQELARLTGIGLSTLFKWSQIPSHEHFRKIAQVPEPMTYIDTFKVILPTGVCVECSSESALKKIVEWLK